VIIKKFSWLKLSKYCFKTESFVKTSVIESKCGFVFVFNFINEDDREMTIAQFSDFVNELAPRIDNLKAFL